MQKLQVARRDLALESAIAKLDKYHLLILDDLAYVTAHLPCPVDGMVDDIARTMAATRRIEAAVACAGAA